MSNARFARYALKCSYCTYGLLNNLQTLHRGYYMRTYVLFNIINEFVKSDNMRYLLTIVSFFTTGLTPMSQSQQKLSAFLVC